MRRPVNEAGIWVAQGLLKTLCKDVEALYQEASERSRDFIHSLQTTSIKVAHIPASLMCAVKRSDIQHGLGLARTVVTKGTQFLYTVVYRLDTLQQVGFDDEIGFFRVF